MIYAIGKPGHAVRAYVETNDLERAFAQCLPGEVAVESANKACWATISTDGLVVEQAAPASWTSDEIRSCRTALLARTDWTQVPDNPLTSEERAAWAAYRRELRDLPENQPTATLETVVWPEPPQ